MIYKISRYHDAQRRRWRLLHNLLLSGYVVRDDRLVRGNMFFVLRTSSEIAYARRNQMKYRTQWVALGESVHGGEYDPDDINDEEVLRIDVIDTNDETVYSLCTAFPARVMDDNYDHYRDWWIHTIQSRINHEDSPKRVLEVCGGYTLEDVKHEMARSLSILAPDGVAGIVYLSGHSPMPALRYVDTQGRQCLYLVGIFPYRHESHYFSLQGQNYMLASFYEGEIAPLQQWGSNWILVQTDDPTMTDGKRHHSLKFMEVKHG